MSIADNAMLVGYGRSTAWDSFLLWLVERTEPYLQLESAPKEILNEIVHRLDALVTTEGALESRLGRAPTGAAVAYSLTSVPSEAVPTSTAQFDSPEYDDAYHYDKPPPEIMMVFGVSAVSPLPRLNAPRAGMPVFAEAITA